MFGNKKGLEKKLRESGGVVAWATVLEAKNRWQSETSTFTSYKVTDHMHVKLRVEPDGEPPFEVEFSQAFSGAAPFKGGSCKVIYDPDDRSKIAMIDGSAVPPGLSRDQAERASARQAEMMQAVESGNIAEYIQEMQAKALSGELGGTVLMGGQVVPQAGAFAPGGPQGGASTPAQPQPSVADQLTKLADLRDRGALTDAEFEAQKAKLLAGS
jgi:hypothetical protein